MERTQAEAMVDEIAHARDEGPYSAALGVDRLLEAGFTAPVAQTLVQILTEAFG
jgi:hypothetical protein